LRGRGLGGCGADGLMQRLYGRTAAGGKGAG